MVFRRLGVHIGTRLMLQDPGVLKRQNFFLPYIVPSQRSRDTLRLRAGYRQTPFTSTIQ